MEEVEISDSKVFGFWIYLMTDLIIFASLFACFIVLRNNLAGGPSLKELLHFPSVLAETLLLLTSSFTCSLAMLSIVHHKKKWALISFLLTFCLGVAFLVMELLEFRDFVERGAIWSTSAFLSSFFTLVGTHGFHIFMGLIWMVVMMFSIGFKPMTEHRISQVFRMALFWHFLDFVWIFIFTVVYGMGYLYA